MYSDSDWIELGSCNDCCPWRRQGSFCHLKPPDSGQPGPRSLLRQWSGMLACWHGRGGWHPEVVGCSGSRTGSRGPVSLACSTGPACSRRCPGRRGRWLLWPPWSRSPRGSVAPPALKGAPPPGRPTHSGCSCSSASRPTASASLSLGCAQNEQLCGNTKRRFGFRDLVSISNTVQTEILQTFLLLVLDTSK